MGKPHGSASHKPITKTLEDPLLGPHIPKKWLRSAISALPGRSILDHCVEVQKWDNYDQGFLKTWSRANNHIPKGAKKKNPEDHNPKKGNYSHALIVINSSPDAWIVDSSASHHMATKKEVHSSLDEFKGPPILMGGNSLVEVTSKGRIELTNGSFKNVPHIPKLCVNLLSVYQMKKFDTKKRALFTPDAVDIYDMQTNFRVATSEVNRQSRLYTFFEFIEPDSALLLTHVDESGRIWHERIGNLNFRYMKQLGK
jgi:hypothetical protein